MQLSCLLALLGASRIAWAAPVANNNQVESASGDLEERFFYTNYDLEKRDEELDKRFFYTHYDLEKRDETAPMCPIHKTSVQCVIRSLSSG
ncbi:hypothetical protein BA78_8776 [Aspergillus fumigatus]|nr:hypothetical protein BA78_8776 [Aspergillus fumigatus]